MEGEPEQTTEDTPAQVPARAKRAGEVRARWDWTEPRVWTERMLTALEQGVKGGKWFSLIDKVAAPANLRAAFARVKANRGAAGVDHQTIEMYAHDLETNLARLSKQLAEGTYQPRAVRRVWIPKDGKKELRPLGIPTVRDRVVQTALRAVLEPIFERKFAAQSYGFRPKRGCKDALRRVTWLLRQGYTWVVDADLKSYFDTIPHGALMERMREQVADGKVLRLLEAFLTQGVMDGLKNWTPERGSPQGAVISPLLSNAYLDPLDHQMAQAGTEMVRYADDFVVLCRSEQEAREALEQVQAWTIQAGLSLHPEKTRIVDATRHSFDFLGYSFVPGRLQPRAKSLTKFKDAIRVKTRRLNGQSLPVIIANVNRTLAGWFQYYKHSHRYTFEPLDRWIRTRLRRIMRRRSGRTRGWVQGADQFRWPNSFFARQGLFSLAQAHRLVCQSSKR
jgi:RNA-directed DNA polymerase